MPVFYVLSRSLFGRQWILTVNKLLGGTKEQGLDILEIGEHFRMIGWDTTNWEEQIKDGPRSSQNPFSGRQKRIEHFLVKTYM